MKKQNKYIGSDFNSFLEEEGISKIIKLECNCTLHRIEVELFKLGNEILGHFQIVKHKSDNTGKLLKNSTVEADAVLSKESLDKLKTFLK